MNRVGRGQAKNLDNVERAVKWKNNGTKLQRVWDVRQPGLCVRVYPLPGSKNETGRRVFYVRYSIPLTKDELADNKKRGVNNGKTHKQVFQKLGDCKDLSIEKARAQAREVQRRAKAGESAEATDHITIGQLFDKIINDTKRLYPMSNTSEIYQRNTEYNFNKNITFKDVPVKDVTADHWLQVIDEHKEAGRFGTAISIKVLAGAFYKNAQADSAFRMLRNPLAGISIYIPKSEPRIPLKADQLKDFVHDPHFPVHSAITKVLILSGQRISEVLRMRWDQIVDGVWIVGEKGEMKNKLSAHHLPLTDGILKAIEPMEAFGSDWVFRGRNEYLQRGPYTRVLKMTNENISPHTFRHTFATLGTDQAGLDPYSVKLVMHHSFGDVTHSVYMKGQQLDRKREALEAWEAYVETLS